jgi:hypothetical protein
MALSGEAKKAYQRELMRKRRAEKKGLEVVTVEPLPMAKDLRVTYEWDSEKYPDRKAFEIAVARVERAKRYAEKFPHLIRVDDLKYQTVEWQYEHEGLPSSRKKETHLVT